MTFPLIFFFFIQSFYENDLFFFKVTTVDNLDVFGMDLKEFAHEIQISIQCSCTVSQSSSNKMQVVIQGNQIAFVAELLTGMSSFFWNESLTQFSLPLIYILFSCAGKYRFFKYGFYFLFFLNSLLIYPYFL